MRYYNYDMTKKMQGDAYDKALQKHFPDNNKWGGCMFADLKGNFDFAEICFLTDVTTDGGATWNHYATIQVCDDNTYEVFSQFNGKNEDELWVHRYFKRFGDACRYVASGKFKNEKPLKIY